MKKPISLLIISVLLMAFCAVPALATDDFSMVTLDDPNDFTLVKSAWLTYEQMTLKGLDSSYQKVTIESQNLIEWTTSNASTAKFWHNGQLVNSVTGTDTVTVYMMSQGSATITGTYHAPGGDISVGSYVVVERLISPDQQETGITIEIVGDQSDSFTLTGKTVKLFDLNTVFGGNFDDADVLKMDPSALHALLYALEYHYDDDEYDITDANWDWDWVPNNVVIDAQGALVVSIGGLDENYYDTQIEKYVGWQYTLNNDDPGYAASVCELDNNDTVKWEFKAYEY